MQFIWVSMYLARKYWLGTLFLRILLERDCHFTWSSEPRQCLAACRAKGLPSFLTYFETLSIGPVPGIEPATSRSTVKRSTDWANPARSVRQRNDATENYCCMSIFRNIFVKTTNFPFSQLWLCLFPLVLDVVVQAKTIAAPSAITKETVLLQVRQIYSSTIGHYRLR